MFPSSSRSSGGCRSRNPTPCRGPALMDQTLISLQRKDLLQDEKLLYVVWHRTDLALAFHMKASTRNLRKDDKQANLPLGKSTHNIRTNHTLKRRLQDRNPVQEA